MVTGDGVAILPSCFAISYIGVDTDTICGFDKIKTGFMELMLLSLIRI